MMQEGLRPVLGGQETAQSEGAREEHTEQQAR